MPVAGMRRFARIARAIAPHQCIHQMIIGIEREIAAWSGLSLPRYPGEVAPINDMHPLPHTARVEFPRERLWIVYLCWDTVRQTSALCVHHLEQLPAIMENKQAMLARLRRSNIALRFKEWTKMPPGHWIKI